MQRTLIVFGIILAPLIYLSLVKGWQLLSISLFGISDDAGFAIGTALTAFTVAIVVIYIVETEED